MMLASFSMNTTDIELPVTIWYYGHIFDNRKKD